MPDEGSVTRWIAGLRAGDEAALGRIFERYWPWLVRLASAGLHGRRPHAADAEDAAQEAFWGFYRSIQAGRLPLLRTRDDLMALWTVIAVRKAAGLVQHDRRLKRGGGALRGESVLDLLASEGARGIEQVGEAGPSPEEQALLKECYERYVGGLPEPMRAVAEPLLAGRTHREIAEALGCSVRSVERKVPLILARWQEMAKELGDA
jgi:DNA-directed RNA polymerase specialized sigma24 family protein